MGFMLYYVLLFLLAWPVLPASAVRPGYATVLLYHRFEEPRYPTTNISTSRFREQMAYLKRNGYRVLSMAEFRKIYAAGGTFPEKSVVITIDDNYRSIYDIAYPILKQFGYPFTLFPYTKDLDSGSADLMTWKMVEEMHAAGVTIGNHSYSHPHFGHPKPGQTRKSYAAWVNEELRQAKRALADHGIESDLLAFPYGEYTPEIIDQAERLGYRVLFAQDEGGVDAQTPRTRIPRVAIVGADMTLTRFIFKLNLAPLHVTRITPASGFLAENPPREFSMYLQNPGRYRPGVVNMFISEWGHVDADYDPQTGRISFLPNRKLTRSMNRLIVTAKEREGGHFSIFSQAFFLPFDASPATGNH